MPCELELPRVRGYIRTKLRKFSTKLLATCLLLIKLFCANSHLARESSKQTCNTHYHSKKEVYAFALFKRSRPPPVARLVWQ